MHDEDLGAIRGATQGLPERPAVLEPHQRLVAHVAAPLRPVPRCFDHALPRSALRLLGRLLLPLAFEFTLALALLFSRNPNHDPSPLPRPPSAAVAPLLLLLTRPQFAPERMQPIEASPGSSLRPRWIVP
jgi:hypothetical protein